MLFPIIYILRLCYSVLRQNFSHEPFYAMFFDYLQFNDVLQSFPTKVLSKSADEKRVFDRKIGRKSGIKNMFFRFLSSKLKTTI